MPERNFQSDFNGFLVSFKRATQQIKYCYMQLPVAGKETPIYRERVYCYELYHQLSPFIEQFPPYSLSGEVDKTGHPYIRGNNLDCVKPDFLLHAPGNMDANLLVMEVKPVNVVQRSNGKKEIKKDLKHLTAFRRIPNSGKYHNAIYLIYGSDRCLFDKVRLHANTLSHDYAEEIDLSVIDLYWHPHDGQQADKQDW